MKMIMMKKWNHRLDVSFYHDDSCEEYPHGPSWTMTTTIPLDSHYTSPAGRGEDADRDDPRPWSLNERFRREKDYETSNKLRPIIVRWLLACLGGYRYYVLIRVMVVVLRPIGNHIMAVVCVCPFAGRGQKFVQESGNGFDRIE